MRGVGIGGVAGGLPSFRMHALACWPFRSRVPSTLQDDAGNTSRKTWRLRTTERRYYGSRHPDEAGAVMA